MAERLESPDWDGQAGVVDLPGGLRVAPLTPLIGAEVHGLDLAAGPLTERQLRSFTQAFLRYKVLMVRGAGEWRMGPDEHTRFCRQLSEHWGIRPDTDQKRMNHSQGLSVHPFLPWLSGYPHIWPTGSVAGGGRQREIRGAEELEIFEPFAGHKRARRASHRPASSRPPRPSYGPGSFGAAALSQDSVQNGANGFHFDDGFFHQPPSAVVLNARVLPKIGGDTVFADMGAAFRGLAPELQERARHLTQTMDWQHAFPLWEEEARRRLEEEGDDSFRAHVDRLKRDYPPSLQPVVRRHPVTGELAIYSNLGFTRHINSVSREESRALMGLLCRMAERPEYQVRMRWHDVGDVCVYDNRITNHYAVADYGEIGPRNLHHIALLGEPTMNALGEVVG